MCTGRVSGGHDIGSSGVSSDGGPGARTRIAPAESCRWHCAPPRCLHTRDCGFADSLRLVLALRWAAASRRQSVPKLCWPCLHSHCPPLSWACCSATCATWRTTMARALAKPRAGTEPGPRWRLRCSALIAVPALGPKWSLLLLSAGYLALLPRRAWNWPWDAAPGLQPCWCWPRWRQGLAFIDVPAGGRILSYKEGATAAVSVVEDRDGVARLRIDNRQQEGSSATRWVDGRQAWLPLLLHPAPRRALFLGLGTGITASTAAQDPELQVDAVELLPEVIAASAFFTREFAADASTSRLRLIAAECASVRAYHGATLRRHRVGQFSSARSGAGSLYTVEHFRAVRSRLTAGGVFCQWLPLHQLDLGTLRSIVQSFCRGISARRSAAGKQQPADAGARPGRAQR